MAFLMMDVGSLIPWQVYVLLVDAGMAFFCTVRAERTKSGNASRHYVR